MYKAIIFDFGNTLAKSASLIDALAELVAVEKAHAIGSLIESEILALYHPDQEVQPNWYDIWERSFNESGLPFTEELGRQHLAAFCRLNETFPQVDSLLQALKESGFKLGLLSNATGPSEIFQTDLESRGLAKFFDAITWSCDIGYRKPYPMAFERCLNDLGVQAKDTLMVGDSEIADIGGAYSVGMDSVLVSMDGKQPTKANYQVAITRLFDDLLAITKTGT